MGKLSLNWTCRSSEDKKASHKAEITLPCEHEGVLQLVAAQIKIVMAQHFEKQKAVDTDEKFATIEAWGRKYQPKVFGKGPSFDEMDAEAQAAYIAELTARAKK